MEMNLNNLCIENVDETVDLVNQDYSTIINTKDGIVIESVFKYLDQRFCELLYELDYDLILGCVAWLTHARILTEISSNCKKVQIVVQKEDFLRPDINFENNRPWWNELRILYDSLECKMERHEFGGIMEKLSVGGDPTVQPIRCVGNYNELKATTFPRSHHKFIVFCKEKPDVVPIAVWTGSFNFTKNATMSFENAIVIKDDSGENKILQSYLDEYYQVFALSEPLDWEHIWCEPEYRIGT